MDLVTLNAPTSQAGNPGVDFYIKDQIQNYDSAIWTERFQTPGEFEIRTADVKGMKKLLPLDTLISHRETGEVMIVETHLRTNGEDGTLLTIKGRSLTSFLENRILYTVYGKSYQLPVDNTYAPKYAAALIWNAVVNQSTQDRSRIGGKRSPLDAIPNTIATVSGYNYLNPATPYWFEAGEVYKEIDKIMKQSGFGFRIQRPGNYTRYSIFNDPLDPRVGWYISGDNTALSKLGIAEDTRDQTNLLAFDVYRSVDFLTTSFSEPEGDIGNVQTLTSNVGYKTLVSALAEGQSSVVRGSDNGQWGLSRRMGAIDAGSPEDGQSSTDFRNKMGDVAQTEYNNRLIKNLIDADFRVNPRAVYNRNYQLGFNITLVDDFGSYSTKRVDEYVRIEDKDGDRGYPGLVDPNQNIS